MSKLKHTPGPWVASGAVRQTRLGEIQVDFGPFSEGSDTYMCSLQAGVATSAANAARIVACVNAMEGIDDPSDLRKQRDDFLEVLHALIGEPGKYARDGVCTLATREVVEMARKALARVEGRL